MIEHYTLYFTITLFSSTFFAMGGVGSAIALVSIFPMMGLNFTVAKTFALFINTTSMISTSYMNFKRGVLDFKLALPLVISLLISTPIGAILSQYVNQELSKQLLAIMLIISATLLLFKVKESKVTYTKKWVLFVIGFVVGIISGLLGVGGGSLIMPLLIILGFDAKKAAYIVSFIIPFSTFGSFVTYLQFVKLDLLLLGVVTVAAIIGGYLGGRIMYYNLSQNQVKKIIAIVLYIIAGKILLGV